jgi:hypothetical protein
MALNSLMFEDRLDDASNFLSWKVRVTLLVEENDLWDILKDVVAPPTDPHDLAAHKKEIKAKRMIMDAIKDHFIPHISEKNTAKKMCDALVVLYQSENINKDMILHNKLKFVEMTRSKTVTSYPMKVTQIREQLATIGEKVEDKELVNRALNGFSPQWKTFVQGVCARENLTS